MHELSLAQSIADAIAARAVALNAARVKRVRLQVGEASGIVVDSLTFCFEAIASLNPLLAGAQLQLDAAPQQARCRRCAHEFRVEDCIAQCPACASWDTDVIAGAELLILSMEIERQGEA
jgi:hydrogenase nickel incorporation protein HypA/HybF